MRLWISAAAVNGFLAGSVLFSGVLYVMGVTGLRAGHEAGPPN